MLLTVALTLSMLTLIPGYGLMSLFLNSERGIILTMSGFLSPKAWSGFSVTFFDWLSSMSLIASSRPFTTVRFPTITRTGPYLLPSTLMPFFSAAFSSVVSIILLSAAVHELYSISTKSPSLKAIKSTRTE